MKKLLFFLVLSAFIGSCRPDEIKFEPDYFIFGKLYPQCTGDCVAFYKLENAVGQQDRMESFDGQNYSFYSEYLPLDKFNIANEIKADFPEILSLNPNSKIGNPNLTGDGGLFFERRVKGVVEKWSIDLDPIKQLPEIRTYIQQLEAAILLLQ